MLKLAITFFLILSYFGCNAQNNKNVDPCEVFGSVFIEKDRQNASFRVYVDSSNAFANLTVFKQSNKLFADKAGNWFFTPTRGFADFSIYIETNKALADFIIYYTKTESFAGCN